MLGPFNSPTGAGISPQLLQQLMAMMQSGGGSAGGANMRAPLANPAPQIPTISAIASSIPFMPTMQGPQQPGGSGDTFSALMPWLQFQQQQQDAANKQQQPQTRVGEAPINANVFKNPFQQNPPLLPAATGNGPNATWDPGAQSVQSMMQNVGPNMGLTPNSGLVPWLMRQLGYSGGYG